MNHNWILFNEYLTLSFSFMTLVIRDQTQNNTLQQTEFEKGAFDKEEFNFIINRRTCFTCDSFVSENYDQLKYVLNQLYKLDPVLLQQLNYYYIDREAQKKGSDNGDIFSMIKSNVNPMNLNPLKMLD